MPILDSNAIYICTSALMSRIYQNGELDMKKVNKNDLKKTDQENTQYQGQEIELEDTIDGEDEYNKEYGEEDAEDNDSGKIIHIAFLLLILGAIAAIIIMLYRWNKGTILEIDEDERQNSFNIESMDYYSHFDPNEFEGYVDDGDLNIVIMGDDAIYNYNDETGIPALIADATGGNVTTLALPGQTVSNITQGYTLDDTRDAYNLYLVLSQMAAGDDGYYDLMVASWDYMDDNKLYYDYWDICHNIDLDKTDVLIISCGQNDFLEGRPCYHDPKDTNANNLNNMSIAMGKALVLLKERFPYMQIIVSSPTMCLVPDENGNLIGADTVNKGYGTYGEYISGLAGMSQMNCVTFVDNFLLDEFNPNNYDGYLEDNGLYPNAKGRKLVADHIVQNIYFIRQETN